MKNDFIEYCKEARREFVNKFMRTYPTSSERVMAEDLLIAYDQLMQRHEEMREILISLDRLEDVRQTMGSVLRTKMIKAIDYDVLRNNS